MNRYAYILICLLIIGHEKPVHAQLLTPEQVLFLQDNAHPVYADESISNGDWSTIAGQLKNKRIVLIGEPNHGSREIFLLRNDLIRYLHQKMGFDVVLFESGIGELILPDVIRQEMSPLQMTNSLFGGWRTKEFTGLMDYIKSSGISISGFDVQRTGNSFRRILTELGTQYKIDTLLYHDLEARYGSLQNQLASSKTVFDSVAPATKKLIAGYRNLYHRLSVSDPGIDSLKLLFSLRTISNRIGYLEYKLQLFSDKNWSKAWAARDKAMAENIKWLCDNIYKGKKIVVIAHNFHIAKSNDNERVMGAMLSKTHSKEMYSVGVFAGSGQYADNFGKSKELVATDSSQLDIKHIITQVAGFVNFLAVPQKKLKGSEWLHQRIIVNDTFIDLKGSNGLVLSKQFDALLLVKRISVPEKQ